MIVYEATLTLSKKKKNDIIDSVNRKIKMRRELLKQQMAVEREVQDQLLQDKITLEEYQEKMKEIKNEYERKKEEMDIA